MASQNDVVAIDGDGKVTKQRRFDARDWSYIAEYVLDEFSRRKQARSDRERQWKEVDRQIAMEPEISFKKLPNGKIDPKKAWMAEVELPLQAQALEVLNADARRMLFADSGAWFRAHTQMTDEYLASTDFTSLILGDEAEVPSKINQDNADKLAEGYLLHLFAETDFFTRCDRINAEALKYAMGVGRGRMETKSVYIHEARGVRKEDQKLPVLVPCSIKNLYLDNPKPSMHSAQILGDSIIAEDWIKLVNLQLAANQGSTDPDDEDGGWMPDNMKKIEPDKDGYVRVLEMEGDVVVPRKTVRSVVIPGAVVTVVVGGKDPAGNVTNGVIRFRFRKEPFSSYLLFPYHYEGVDEPYPAGPLMKGRPVQMMATDALNRLLDSAMLKNAPPVGWDRTDMVFAQAGGPEIYPYAQWGSTDAIKVHSEVGGDPSALASAMTLGVNLYAELTGVLPARLGAQTNSHTTAFAKDAELQRGAVRTVSYVRRTGNGPLVRWLNMAYTMGRKSIGPRETVSFYIGAYGGYVEVERKHLPEHATFEWFGSGGPAEEQAQRQAKLSALGLALQMEQLGMAMGEPKTIDVPAAIREVLREGGWTDVDAITKLAGAVAGPSAAPQLPGPNPGGPGPALEALPPIAGAGG